VQGPTVTVYTCMWANGINDGGRLRRTGRGGYVTTRGSYVTKLAMVL
jgi:hypothetical protein